jgi:hypothetical protein
LKSYIKTFYSDDIGNANSALNSYFQNFENKSEDFVFDEYDKDPSAFCSVYGRKSYPSLSRIAKRLYSIVPSSAASQRGWNVCSTIHTKKRNRLSNEKVEKLAFVYINATLLDEKDNREYTVDSDTDEDGELSDVVLCY